ncbi:MAG: restriction endonuclease subunit S [Oscillospiraceae bacterium]|nr:restriction endonuclease subunit S [Oscillospiraceae bacterium]
MRIGDFCKTNLHTYSEKEKWSEIHYLDTGNITRGKVDEIQILVPGKDTIPSRARRKVQIDDIVYSTVRPNQRHYGIIKNFDPNMLVSTGFVVITVDQQIADSDFIYYFLTQDDITETLQAIGEQSTSAYPSIKPVDIENLEIELPSLEEQRAVGAFLRLLDEKCAANDRINDNLAA